jgi:hypothetical protein
MVFCRPNSEVVSRVGIGVTAWNLGSAGASPGFARHSLLVSHRRNEKGHTLWMRLLPDGVPDCFGALRVDSNYPARDLRASNPIRSTVSAMVAVAPTGSGSAR